MVFFLKVLGGLAALGLGLYLGGGSNTQTPEEMAARFGNGTPRKAKRHFMWLDYLKPTPTASQRRRERRPFRTAVAQDRNSDSE